MDDRELPGWVGSMRMAVYSGWWSYGRVSIPGGYENFSGTADFREQLRGSNCLPCVAHLVCAIPACESKTLSKSGASSAMSCFNLATFPTSLNAKTSFFLSPSTARPAESYPLYSSRERPLTRVSKMYRRSFSTRYCRTSVHFPGDISLLMFE